MTDETKSDPKPANPKADALAKQLKDSLAKRRPRTWKVVLPVLFGSALLIALAAWWLYPRPKGLPLQIIALDTICTPDETPHAIAQLLEAPESAVSQRLSGRTVVFREQRLLIAPDVKPREVVTTSDARAQASAEWPVGQAALTEFLVLHVDAEQRRGSPHERGRIYVWPKDAPLLIVDADETLIADELDAKASEALIKAAKDGWRIVYLNLASEQPHEFRTARIWMEKHAGLPIGPLLGRKKFPDDTPVEQVRHDLLKDLQGRFQGKLLAVVKTEASANVCKELDLPTIILGGAATPTWADVPAQLK
jgi:hypothetical protein